MYSDIMAMTGRSGTFGSKSNVGGNGSKGTLTDVAGKGGIRWKSGNSWVDHPDFGVNPLFRNLHNEKAASRRPFQILADSP
jgi:hypothetical protein